jgi:hypothetical protein
MPVLSDYACKVCLQRLSKISLLEAHFLLPTSSHHLGISPLCFFLKLVFSLLYAEILHSCFIMLFVIYTVLKYNLLVCGLSFHFLNVVF